MRAQREPRHQVGGKMKPLFEWRRQRATDAALGLATTQASEAETGGLAHLALEGTLDAAVGLC